MLCSPQLELYDVQKAAIIPKRPDVDISSRLSTVHAFRHAFSSKFFVKCEFLLPKKIRFRCFSEKPKSSRKSLQASSKRENNSALVVRPGIAVVGYTGDRGHGGLYVSRVLAGSAAAARGDVAAGLGA